MSETMLLGTPCILMMNSENNFAIEDVMIRVVIVIKWKPFDRQSTTTSMFDFFC